MIREREMVFAKTMSKVANDRKIDVITKPKKS